MKFSIIPFIFLLFFSCKNNIPGYELEDKLYECFKNQSINSVQIDPDKIISAMESLLKKEGKLKEINGRGYYDWIEKIVKEGHPNLTIPKDLEAQINLIDGNGRECQHFIQDTTSIQNTRFFAITKGFGKAFENISKSGDLGVENIGKEIFKYFKEEDFNHPLYKIGAYKFLVFQINLWNQDRGILSKLPPWSDDEPITKLKERNVLSVLVNAKNELLVRGELMNVKDLKKLTKEFLSNPNANPNFSENPQKAIISLKNERGTKYEIYLKVLNELKAAYHELRNEKAMELYGKGFEALEKEQQKEIRSMIPLIISEAEPTAFGDE